MKLPEELARALELSGYCESGFAERYDAVRPRPPQVLLEWLPRLAGVERPRLVVDIGSGTGLSTRAWAGRADAVVGVEPNTAMRRWAVRSTRDTNVRYVAGHAGATGIDECGADVVTCAQSLQWLQPGPTFREVARILRPGGVFAAYQYEAIQTPYWHPEAAFAEVRAATRRLRHERGLDEGRGQWPVSIERLERAGCFSECRELLVHGLEDGNAPRLVGFALSEGSLQTLLASGATEADVGLDRLRAVAAETIGDTRCPWLVSFRAWIGLRR